MIYAINKRTKEHVRRSEVVGMPGDWSFVEADAEGWIPWDSGVCPLPDGSAVEYQMGDGVKARCHSAEKLRWASSSDLGYGSFYKDIIAYRPILDTNTKPEPPAWAGEGLPPVGCECEVDWSCGGDWRAVKIIHYSGGKIWVRDTSGDHIIWEDAAFRPIRSEEDEAVKEMVGIVGDFDRNEGVCRALYRAGYQKGESTATRMALEKFQKSLFDMCEMWRTVCSSNGWDETHMPQYEHALYLSNNFPPIVEDVNIDNRDEEVFKLRQALEEMVDTYTELFGSGDFGNWNPEKDQAVIMARAVLAETEK